MLLGGKATLGNEEKLLPLFTRGEEFSGTPFSVDDEGRLWRHVEKDALLPAPRRAEYSTGSRGYLMLRAYLDGGVVRVLAHRMVYRALVGTIPEHHVIDHRDGRKQNNRPSNLVAVLPVENTRRAIQNGQRGQYGERNPQAKLPDEAVECLRGLYLSGISSTMELAREFGLHRSTVLKIVNGARR